jgi:hypothetical protein
VTPLPLESWLTTAVRDADPPAGTEAESADTDTEVAGGVGVNVAELPPAQPVMTTSETNPKTHPTRDGTRLIYAPPGSFLGEGVATSALNSREDFYRLRKCQGAAVLTFSCLCRNCRQREKEPVTGFLQLRG